MIGLNHNTTGASGIHRVAAAQLVTITVEATCLAAATVGLRAFWPGYWPAILLIAWAVGWAVLKVLRNPASLMGTPAEALDDSALVSQLGRFARDHAGMEVRLYRLAGGAWTRRPAVAVAGSRAGLAVYFTTGALEQFSRRELRAAFAHELGHAAGARGLLITAICALWRVGVLAGLYFTLDALSLPGGYRPIDTGELLRVFAAAAGLAWIALLAFLPIRNGLLRSEERRANAWALEASGDPAALLAALRKTAPAGAERHAGLAGKVFRTHPSFREVHDQSLRFAGDNGIDMQNDPRL